jgi:hypothetical protein
MKTTSLALAATLAVTLAAAPVLVPAALADSPPTAGERAQLAKVLRAHGFVAWRKIERDDGRWEVDNAVTRSGKVYDVDIVGGRIVDWDRE